MDEYLQDLIERMNSDNHQDFLDGVISSETISWKALREAEKIKKPEYIKVLMSYIDKEKNKKNRDRAYFVLGKIAENINDLRTGQFLINRIKKETDKYIISSMLDRLEYLNKPKETNLEPLIFATKNNEGLIRYSAISALKLTDNKNAEERIIEILNNSNDKYDLNYSLSTLFDIGTEKSIPSIIRLLDNKSTDVSNSALYLLIQIAQEKEIELYRKHLVKGRNKAPAIIGVVQYGNENDIDIVLKRIKELISRKRKYEINIEQNKTELIVGLEFLKINKVFKEKYLKLLNWLATKKKDKLWKDELTWINKQLPPTKCINNKGFGA